MSPLWRDELYIVLSPGRIVLRGLRRGRQPRVQERIIACDDAGVVSWDSGLTALRSAVAAGDWRGARTTVVLSNHFVRYAIVPACPELNEAEYSEYARHHFVKTYGPSASDWVLRINPDAAAAPRLASAVGPKLLVALAEALHAGGLRLASIQPCLMKVYNDHCSRLGTGCVWLALAEPGRVALLLRNGERWIGAWAARCGADWKAELLALLDRARYLADAPHDARTVWLHTLDLVPGVFPERPWNIRLLALAHQHPGTGTDAPALP